MRWKKEVHLIALGLASCVAWLGAAAPARATMIVRYPPYEDLSAMPPHLRAAWKATSIPILVTDEDPVTGTAAAPAPQTPDPDPPTQDLPTSAVPEPASGGFLLLGVASLWLLRFRYGNRLL